MVGPSTRQIPYHTYYRTFVQYTTIVDNILGRNKSLSLRNMTEGNGEAIL